MQTTFGWRLSGRRRLRQRLEALLGGAARDAVRAKHDAAPVLRLGEHKHVLVLARGRHGRHEQAVAVVRDDRVRVARRDVRPRVHQPRHDLHLALALPGRTAGLSSALAAFWPPAHVCAAAAGQQPLL